MTEQFGLQGYIVNANWIIYKQMIFSFAASLLFVLITSACYAYLIRTILRQKTVAQIKNDFVNNMTHELKTPITVTYSAIDALQTFNQVEQKEKREALKPSISALFPFPFTICPSVCDGSSPPPILYRKMFMFN